MNFYTYTGTTLQANNAHRSFQRGTILAASLEEATAILKGESVSVLRCRRSWTLNLLCAKMSLESQAAFWLNFHYLLSGALKVHEALFALENAYTHNAKMLALIRSLRRFLTKGDALSRACKKHAVFFDPLTFQLLEVGETCGVLPLVIKDLSDRLHQRGRFYHELFKSLLYPFLILFFIVVLYAGYTLYLGPELAQLTVQTPRETRLPLVPIILGFILTLGGFGLYKTMKKTCLPFRERVSIFLYKIPLIGPTLALSRYETWFFGLSLLVSHSVPLSLALEKLEGIFSCRSLRNTFLHLRKKIQEGVSFGAAARHFCPALPPVALSLLHVGEKSGQFGPTLKTISLILREKTKERLEAVEKLLPPFLMGTLGLVLAYLTYTWLAPLYEWLEKSGSSFS